MDKSEFEKRINDLEKNFSFSKPSESDNDFIKQSKIETVEYLSNKLNKIQSEYENEIRLKDSLINDLKNQIEALHAHIKEVKEHYDRAKEDLMQEQLLQAVRLQETEKILKDQKNSHQKEIQLLQDLLSRSRDEIKNLTDKIEKLNKERNELREKIKNIEIEKMNLKDKVSALENNLNDSKKAVEETLGQLFEERKLHNDSKKLIKELQNKLDEAKKELENAKLNWDAERKEWRELWDRERSVWETHRQEFAIWEERLRNEREAWLERLRQEEGKSVDNAKIITKILEDTSKWSEKVTQVLKLYATKGVQLPHVFVTPEVITKKTVSGFRKVFAITLLSIISLALLSWWIYDYKNKLHFSLVSQFNLDDSNYTAIASDKDNIILSHWNKGVIFKNKKFENIGIIDNFSGQKLKISAMTLSENFIWLLDISQLRILKIDFKGNIIKFFPLAGPAPQGLAYDGFNIWTFDSSTGLIYRYNINGEVKGIITYSLNGIKNIDSMQWIGNNLFVLSEGKLIKYIYENDIFKKKSSQTLKNAFAFYFDNDRFFVFENKGSLNQLVEYKVRNK